MQNFKPKYKINEWVIKTNSPPNSLKKKVLGLNQIHRCKSLSREKHFVSQKILNDSCSKIATSEPWLQWGLHTWHQLHDTNVALSNLTAQMCFLLLNPLLYCQILYLYFPILWISQKIHTKYNSYEHRHAAWNNVHHICSTSVVQKCAMIRVVKRYICWISKMSSLAKLLITPHWDGVHK